ncbi:hypothetical protein HBI56_108180 [Parastagonospora nodorum]|nr:hypothetical protein HBI95_232340 [Parastagonospora nodorum]KAH4302614.1 hypothetical protein HBI01_088040 [Parastagonospora nodorum]KAH4312182.1 hypothetical protein HBI02_091150 [Parastagonospora nodorum]KAH4331501.1 hypothetical protein HBI00_076380 [Parastagonospora nodorum]KAH4371432.1 hypothetical protein HBH94_113810 [Parastagonospora nodorum]
MPIQDNLQIPFSAQELPVPDDPAAKLFVCFISSADPVTKQPWCPDVRAALPRLDAAFSSEDAPNLAYVHVGQKPEWKEMDNLYRKTWGVNAIPALVRYQRINGVVKETGRLVEAEIMDEEKVLSLVSESGWL